MLAKWTPFATAALTRETPELPALDAFVREADRLFDLPLFTAPRWAQLPAADIHEDEQALRLELELPGYDPQALTVQVEGDVLTVRAQRAETKRASGNALRRERQFGSVARSFVLPDSVDGSQCQATYEHGVLTLTLPKREEAKPRTITVKVQS